MIPLRTTLPAFTDRLPLSASPLRVSPICLGMVRDPETIPAAFDAGINIFFFFSADMHWPLYEPSRQGLAGLLARGAYAGELPRRLEIYRRPRP
jgi:hypothetical protein